MATDSDLAIETIDLSKFYGAHRGCDGVALAVERGARFGFLGPNGAGKTTTIRLLLSLLRPSRGQAFVLGEDVRAREPRRFERVGYAPAEVALYPELTGRWILERFGRLRGDRKPAFRALVTDALALTERDLARRVGAYSTGMKRKLTLAIALQHDPEVAILDEPTAGLDPVVQRSVLDLLRDLGRRGRTVFFSSHNLPEVEAVCDRVGLVFDGRLIAQEGVAELKARPRRRVRITLRDPSAMPDLALDDVSIESREGADVVVRIAGPIGRLLQALPIADVVDLTSTPPTLEDVFFDYYRATGR